MNSKKTILLGLIMATALLLVAPSVSATSVSSGTVIKGSTDSVYYLGADNKRYVFPTLKTFLTWFPDFSIVILINDSTLSELPLGGNVTYKPDSRLVKITTDPKVYYVDKSGTLRWIKTETVAVILFGSDWNKMIDDVPDSFFTNYQTGEEIDSVDDIVTVEDDYSINEDKGLSTEPDPTYSEDQSINLTGSVSGNTINVSWSLENFNSPKGFKVVKSTEANPVYPGNDYHYKSEPETRSDSWTGLSAGTYHFRVCEYLGGSCGLYSNDLTLTVTETSSNTNGKITLSKTVSDNDVSLSWTLTDMTSFQGFKVVKAEHTNPVYPGDDYHYLTDENTRSDSWENLENGTYHFRVCEYLGGKCGIYSNDITVTINVSNSCTSCNSRSITLTKSVSGNNLTLNWTLSNMTSSMGFKVVKAEHSNPIYPGDDYHYLSDADTRSDSWENLESGTYHFRVCEYLGGKCGTYSNDLTVSIP